MSEKSTDEMIEELHKKGRSNSIKIETKMFKKGKKEPEEFKA